MRNTWNYYSYQAGEAYCEPTARRITDDTWLEIHGQKVIRREGEVATDLYGPRTLSPAVVGFE